MMMYIIIILIDKTYEGYVEYDSCGNYNEERKTKREVFGQTDLYKPDLILSYNY